MNERLTAAAAEPEKALNSTAAVETKRLSFMLMFALISDQNYDYDRQAVEMKQIQIEDDMQPP